MCEPSMLSIRVCSVKTPKVAFEIALIGNGDAIFGAAKAKRDENWQKSPIDGVLETEIHFGHLRLRHEDVACGRSGDPHRGTEVTE